MKGGYLAKDSSGTLCRSLELFPWEIPFSSFLCLLSFSCLSFRRLSPHLSETSALGEMFGFLLFMHNGSGSASTQGSVCVCVCVCVCIHVLSCVQLCDSMDCSRQAPLSMRLSRQEYWSGLPCPPPGDLPDPGTDPASLCLLLWQAVSLPLAHLGSPGSP